MTILWFALATAYGFGDELQLGKGIKKAAAVTRLCLPRHDEEPKRGLLHLVESFWANEATDLRDKVYALLGLAVDEHSESIIPNYESSVSLVYAESVRDIITREGNLQVLSYSSGPSVHGEIAIPSWAPDWRSTAYNLNGPPEHRRSSLYQVDMELRKNYRTAKPKQVVFRSAGDTPPAVGFCKQMKRLYAVGICVDVVCNTSKTRNYDYSLEEVKDEWGTINGWNDRTNFYLPTGQLKFDACVDTLSASQFTPKSDLREVLASFVPAISGRKFFVGEAGYQGLASSFAQVGDVMAVLLGGAYPLTLRKVNDHYIMVGEAYVHGIMYGEMMTRLENGWAELEEFEIW
ncbi:hypothetical protein MMC28_010540 [Mycoblastus sanguinarius]|nr:hypothetical protein [Mycoblastus sanguinarius]